MISEIQSQKCSPNSCTWGSHITLHIIGTDRNWNCISKIKKLGQHFKTTELGLYFWDHRNCHSLPWPLLFANPCHWYHNCWSQKHCQFLLLQLRVVVVFRRVVMEGGGCVAKVWLGMLWHDESYPWTRENPYLWVSHDTPRLPMLIPTYCREI